MFASLILQKLYNKHRKVQVEFNLPLYTKCSIFLFQLTQNLESLSKFFFTFPVLGFVELLGAVNSVKNKTMNIWLNDGVY